MCLLRFMLMLACFSGSREDRPTDALFLELNSFWFCSEWCCAGMASKLFVLFGTSHSRDCRIDRDVARFGVRVPSTGSPFKFLGRPPFRAPTVASVNPEHNFMASFQSSDDFPTETYTVQYVVDDLLFSVFFSFCITVNCLVLSANVPIFW
jgi:hypothetical protein